MVLILGFLAFGSEKAGIFVGFIRSWETVVVSEQGCRFLWQLLRVIALSCCASRDVTCRA